MASLIDIRRRLRSVKNTQQITRAMKMVAAAKLRRSQDRVIAARPYAAALLLDYILSEPAQKIFSDFGRISARRGVRPRYPDIDIEAKGVKVLLLTPDDAVQFDKPYQQLREEFLLNRQQN